MIFFKILKRIIHLGYLYIPIIFKIWYYGIQDSYLIELREMIKKSGCAFIKLTQWIIQRPYSINQKIVSELKILQTYCQEYSLKDLLSGIELEISNLEIDPKPIGIGSVAQVHRAQLIQNDQKLDVVIKMRHPYIEEMMEIDLKIIYWLIRIFNFRYKIFKNHVVIETILNNIHQQIFLKNEKENLDKLRKIFYQSDLIKLPEILDATDSYIIETYCPGQHLNLIKSNREQYLNVRIKILKAYLEMIKHGAIHVDLHDGNILCDHDSIYLIDFGMMIFLTPKEVKSFRQLIISYYNFYQTGTPDSLISSLKHFTENQFNRENRIKLRKLLLKYTKRNISKQILFKASKISQLFDELMDFFRKNQIYINDHFIYLILNLSMIEANVTNEYRINFIGNLIKN